MQEITESSHSSTFSFVPAPNIDRIHPPSFEAQSQELGQTGTIALAHLLLMSRQQIIVPGLDRLGRLQWKGGQVEMAEEF